MSYTESNARRLARARRSIEGFEARNRYQKELRALLVAMMDYIEKEHCSHPPIDPPKGTHSHPPSIPPRGRSKPPRSVPRRRGSPATSKAGREFDRWMGILHRHWRVLVSPQMASRRARAVLAKLLG